MTRRAARMLAALEDGCQTRAEIFAHQGRFSLLNNGAAELRAAGITVECLLVDGEYVYLLAPVIRRPEGAPRAGGEGLHVVEESGQLAFGVAA